MSERLSQAGKAEKAEELNKAGFSKAE